MTHEESEEVRKYIRKAVRARSVYQMLENLVSAVRRTGGLGTGVRMKITPGDEHGTLKFVLMKDTNEVEVFSETESAILAYFIDGAKYKRTFSVSRDDDVRVAQVQDAPFNMTKTARRKAARAKPTWAVVFDTHGIGVSILASSERQDHMVAFCQGYRSCPDWLDIVGST